MTSLREFFSLPTGSRGLGRDAPVGVDELGRQVYRTPIGQQYAATTAPRVNIGEAIAQGAQAFRESPSEATRNVARALLESAWNGVAAPGRALAGETVTYGDVADTALDWGIMGAFNRAPEGSLRIFAGRNAQTADTGALQRAQDMAQAGANRDEIWRDTGWFQGVDGQWRFEIDDSGARATMGLDPIWSQNRRDLALEDGFVHDGYFEAYPSHREVGVADFPDRYRGFASGAYDRDADYIYLSEPIRSGADPRDVALHEMQHVVQDAEGFARGGSPSIFSNETTPDNVFARMQELIARGVPESDARDIAMRDLLPTGQYRRLAGEVEARNVQTRQNFTPEQRRATPPWATMDVPEADQIVRMSGGTSSLEALQAYIRGVR